MIYMSIKKLFNFYIRANYQPHYKNFWCKTALNEINKGLPKFYHKTYSIEYIQSRSLQQNFWVNYVPKCKFTFAYVKHEWIVNFGNEIFTYPRTTITFFLFLLCQRQFKKTYFTLLNLEKTQRKRTCLFTLYNLLCYTCGKVSITKNSI